VTSRVLLFDAHDRIALVLDGGRWTVPIAEVEAPVWSRGDVVFGSTVIEPSAAPAGARWWTLGELVGERPPFDPPELIDLIRRQLPSCFA
jgi:hypothetical protein